MGQEKKYFCSEPWTGVLSVTTDLSAIFCPCYLKMKIGSLDRNTIAELWNSEALVGLRNSFAKGELPAPCRSQLCPVVVGPENHKMG
jgi:Iron-sulfur cluster-binding domain